MAETACGSPSLRRPSGSRATPNSISARVMADTQTRSVGWASSQATTWGAGAGRMNSDRTFVSSRIMQTHPTLVAYAAARAAESPSRSPRPGSGGSAVGQDLADYWIRPMLDAKCSAPLLPWSGHGVQPALAKRTSVPHPDRESSAWPCALLWHQSHMRILVNALQRRNKLEPSLNASSHYGR